MRAGSPWNAIRSGASSSQRCRSSSSGKSDAQLGVDHRDVGRIPGQRRPAKRPDPATEERPDIGRDEARV